MVDLSYKGSEISSQTPTVVDRVSSDAKTCVHCGTSTTPLWRGGPSGPKSLCNACGIRSRKKRRALMGITKEEMKTKKSNSSSNSKNWTPLNHSSNSSCTSGSEDSTTKIGDSLKKGLFAFNREAIISLLRPRSNITQRRKMGEVERAACLLMALSCGSVTASVFA